MVSPEPTASFEASTIRFSLQMLGKRGIRSVQQFNTGDLAQNLCRRLPCPLIARGFFALHRCVDRQRNSCAGGFHSGVGRVASWFAARSRRAASLGALKHYLQLLQGGVNELKCSRSVGGLPDGAIGMIENKAQALARRFPFQFCLDEGG